MTNNLLAVKTVIKSDGREEPFDFKKLLRWAEWADKSGCSWNEVSVIAATKLQDKCTTSEVNKAIIDACSEMFTQGSFALAGRILIGEIYKQAYGGFERIPVLKDHHDTMVSLGYWEDLSGTYSLEDFKAFESEIRHDRDLSLVYSEVKQLNDKYLCRDRVKGRTLESPQMMYMGMAMANMSGEPEAVRRERVIKLYNFLSRRLINAPTPFLCFLRTPHRGFASCCVSTCEDTIPSLAAQDHIAYIMTAASAGIGAHLKTRSLGDPVRNGSIVHQGKFGYIKLLSALVAANLQNNRGGAATIHLNPHDPEILSQLKLRSAKTPLENRIGEVQYSIGFHRLLAKKVKNKEDWMLVSYADAPDLIEASYSGDFEEYERLYNEVLDDLRIPKKFVKAYDLILEICVQSVETGGTYTHNALEMNRHTPFKGKIYSSNLCVAPETRILTDEGYKTISDLQGRAVNVWNGEEFSPTIVEKTGSNQKLLKVVTSSGAELEATPYHKWYISPDYSGRIVEKRTYELEEGDRLVKFQLPVVKGRDVLEKSYQSGFFTADGCQVGNQSRIYLYGDKKGLLERFDLTSVTNQPEQDRIYGNESGLKPKYFVPSSQYSVDSRLEWLAGYLDGDGCVYSNGDHQSLAVSSVKKGFIKELQLMLQTLGVSSKFSVCLDGGDYDLPDGKGGYSGYSCKTAYRLTINGSDTQHLLSLGLGKYLLRLKVYERNLQRSASRFNTVVSVTDEGRFDDTYCFTEKERGMGLFNGILTGQCQEIALPTRGYKNVHELNVYGPTSGEIGLCNLAAIVAGRATEEELPEVYFYTLLMVDNVITKMTYPFPNLKWTAQARRSVGIGLTNFAHHMAKNGYKYSTEEGRAFIHREAEKHSYLLHRASYLLAKEKGLPEMMTKEHSKYPGGWLPIDTYCKAVDKVVDQKLLCDWESLRQQIIQLGGIRNSVLEAYMPNESSSIATFGTNSILPARGLKIKKTNKEKVIKFLAPDADTLSDEYELAYSIDPMRLIECYAIFQKFTGQAISADLYYDAREDIDANAMIAHAIYMVVLGVKTRYYVNTETSTGMEDDQNVVSYEEEESCSGGACKL